MFDERAEANALLTEQGAAFELRIDDERLRAYIIAVQL
jgi:hypothetical protein